MVRLAGIDCSTTFVSATELTFIVTAVAGSVSPPVPGVVARPDGRTTKPFGLQVLPTITSFAPTAARPGQEITVTGTGFPPITRVLLDGQSQPEVQVHSTTSLTFRATIPINALPAETLPWLWRSKTAQPSLPFICCA